jgi:hypothetical protein
MRVMGLLLSAGLGLQGGVLANRTQVLHHEPLPDATSMEVVPAVKRPEIVSIDILFLDKQRELR